MNGKRASWLAISGLAVVILLVAFHQQILWSLGAMLVHTDPPKKSDIVVVLGGDWQGNRILKAAGLVREGYAPRVLVSGSGRMYGAYEADLAVNFATAKGYPRDIFIPLQYPAVSTVDEARNDLKKLRAMGVHRILLVTSEYHTARASRIFRRDAKDIDIHTIASATPEWGGGDWWKQREGQKIWLAEFEKTLANYLGI